MRPEPAAATAPAPIQFPADFKWGVSSSAYQIEGSIDAEGRGPSIWDTFAQSPGRIRGGDTGEVATDHYRRYAEDIALMSELGVKTYRFSIAWPRIQPDGRGRPNLGGLDFYSRLIDRLLGAAIEPMATLYHWDLPQALQDAGGWPARDTAERFADYAASTFAALRDRVSTWATINEPWCSAFLGYATGLHAPGLRDPGLAAAAVHHLLLGHGLAVGAMRAVDTNPRLGIVLNVAPVRPLGGHEGADLIDVTRRVDGLRNRLFLDPLLLGQYPTDVLKDLDPFGGLPIRAEDLATIGQRLDWIGINYYNDIFVKPAPGRTPLGELYPGTTDAGEAAPGPLTDMGWPISPEGLHQLLVTILDRYPEAPPLMITENGAAYSDPIGSDGTMRDERRIAYLDAHIRAVHRAIVDGVDVRGYLIWTLVDNFEWAEGYAMRFGLVHLDRGTLRRTPRRSAAWYRAVINRNGLLAHLDSHGHDVDLRQRSDG